MAEVTPGPDFRREGVESEVFFGLADVRIIKLSFTRVTKLLGPYSQCDKFMDFIAITIFFAIFVLSEIFCKTKIKDFFITSNHN